MTASTAITLEAELREGAGKGAARAQRRAGNVPAVLYGAKDANVNLAIGENALVLAYKKGGFFSRVVTLKLGKETVQALPRDMQLHPVSDRVEHVDFLRLDAKEKVKVAVPVHFLNADRCVGIKRGGVLNVVRHAIELVCLPADIPSAIEVDLLEKDIGDSVHIGDVALPNGVNPAIRDRNFTIATVAGRSSSMMEEEAKPAAAAATAGAEGAAAAPAEGGAAAPAAAAAGAAAPAADAKAKGKK